jgi:KEOPS complex subunit Cgi121
LKPQIQFIGCKSKIEDANEFIDRIKAFESKHDIKMQAMNAELIFGKDHLSSAKEHAIRAFERNENACDTLPMEVMLYASGEVQIKTVLKKMGLKTGTKGIVIIFDGDADKNRMLEALNLKEDEKVIEPDLSKISDFGIKGRISKMDTTEAVNLVLEKVALVDLYK